MDAGLAVQGLALAPPNQVLAIWYPCRLRIFWRGSGLTLPSTNGTSAIRRRAVRRRQVGVEAPRRISRRRCRRPVAGSSGDSSLGDKTSDRAVKSSSCSLVSVTAPAGTKPAATSCATAPGDAGETATPARRRLRRAGGQGSTPTRAEAPPRGERGARRRCRRGLPAARHPTWHVTVRFAAGRRSRLRRRLRANTASKTFTQGLPRTVTYHRRGSAGAPLVRGLTSAVTRAGCQFRLPSDQTGRLAARCRDRPARLRYLTSPSASCFEITPRAFRPASGRCSAHVRARSYPVLAEPGGRRGSAWRGGIPAGCGQHDWHGDGRGEPLAGALRRQAAGVPYGWSAWHRAEHLAGGLAGGREDVAFQW